ncbi:Cytoplasmic axial filament protein CafA and Ribonuclease G [invertebrate metagenome]|uniref:Cytoplasmic axial filament protein CafA and Ribonuclease G n=1 Tax=invertebrate metagenome TaxID=1711999 RepID=A0A484H694_9ZZZZ
MRYNNRTTDLIIVRDGSRPYGSVHLGRVIKVLPGAQAVLVDIGGPQLGFLPRETAHDWSLSEGMTLLVQVTREERAGKGAKLSRHVTLAGLLTVLSPRRPGVVVSRYLYDDHSECQRLAEVVQPVLVGNEGVIIRSCAAGAAPHCLKNEIQSLRQRWQTLMAAAATLLPPARLDSGADPLAELLARAIVDTARTRTCPILMICDNVGLLTCAHTLGKLLEPAVLVHLHTGLSPGTLFQEYELEADIEAALEREVPLACGGRLHIESTAALTAIDVDTAAAGLDAAEAVNQAAVAVIAQHMRLRNLSGALVVDFITRRPASKRLRRVVSTLRAAVACDPLKVQVSGPSVLGLVEMIRERRRVSLADLLLEPHDSSHRGVTLNPVTIGLSALRLVLQETTAQRHTGLGLEVAPIVAECLTGSLIMAVMEAEAHLGHRLVIRASPARRLDEVVVMTTL